MASISANGSKGHHKFTLEVTQGTQDVTNNKTTISYSFKLSPIQTSWNWEQWGSNINYKITINGTEYTGSIPNYDGYATVTLKSGTQSVAHNSDGSKSISYSFSVTDTSGQTYTPGNASASGTLALTTIPRATTPTLSATSVTMGQSVTITIKPASSTFKHKVRYAFGSLTGQTGGLSVGTDFTAQGDLTVTFTPPTSLGSQIPTANSGTCTITVYTYQENGWSVGTKTINLTLNVPSYTPSVSIAISGNGLLGGEYVQGKSTVKGTITASSQYGAGISSISSVVDGKTYTSNPFTSSVLSSGTKSVVVTIKDSRGKTASVTSAQFTVREYAIPYITSVTATRQSNGTSVNVTLNGGVSSVNGKNAKTFKVTLNGVTNTLTSTTNTINATTTFTNVSTDKTFEVKAQITDSYTTVSKTATLPTVAVTMDFFRDGKGIAMGKVAETSGLLDVAWPTKVKGIKFQRGTRPTSANIAPEADYYGSLEYYLVSNSMSEGRPMEVSGQAASNHDGHLLHFHWDNNGGWDSQLFIKNSTGALLTRGCNAGKWESWKQMLDLSMCKDYVIEQGTSNGWEYTKWNNGKIELFGEKSLSFPAGTKQTDYLYRSIVSLNLSGLLTNIMSGTCSVQINGMVPQVCRHSTTKTTAEIVIVTSRTFEAFTLTAPIYIIGKWK